MSGERALLSFFHREVVRGTLHARVFPHSDFSSRLWVRTAFQKSKHVSLGFFFFYIRIFICAGHQWLTPIIIDTQEAEIYLKQIV
jgi:hypothetical protein